MCGMNWVLLSLCIVGIRTGWSSLVMISSRHDLHPMSIYRYAFMREFFFILNILSFLRAPEKLMLQFCYGRYCFCGQGWQSVEPDPRFDRGSTGDIRCSVKPVPTCSKIKVRPNRIGLELRYVGRDRSERLNPTDIPDNCYRRNVTGEVAYSIQLSLFL
jgi:hypothetical protein